MTSNLASKTIEFTIRVNYESDDGSEVCEEAAKERMYRAIENERLNGAIGSADVSAEGLSVSISKVKPSAIVS